MSGGAPKEVFALLAPRFEQQTNNKVEFTYAVITELREKLSAGAAADVLVLPTEVLDSLAKDGSPGDRTVRNCATKPAGKRLPGTLKIGQVAKSRRHSREPHDLSAAWANWRCWRTLTPGRRIIRRGPIHALERATKWHRPGR